jgi:hypothetical protein
MEDTLVDQGALMHYVKITTNDDETRWINLTQVCRFTLATDAARGFPVLAIMFAHGAPDEKLLINGNNETDRKAIETVTKELESLVGSGRR